MKKFLNLIIVILLCLNSCATQTKKEDVSDNNETQSAIVDVEDGGTMNMSYVPQTPNSVKAVWLSQWDMQRVFLKGSSQRSETDFRVRATEIMHNARQDGFNTVFLQVRPFGDSFYPSDFYPPSKMVVGEYGNEFIYDPIKILIESAHEEGLSIHAWINPFRLMTTEEIECVDDRYSIRRWYDSQQLRGRYLVLQADGRWYLNPGYSEVRNLIIDGAEEIFENYPVDGLHLDDYFYPTTSTSYDAECFANYVTAGGEMSLADFRRDCISQLVHELWGMVHEISPKALFGIAPGGNPDRAYSVQYADVFRWGRELGFVDYLCPEIYFGFEHESYPFDKTANRWSEIVSCSYVKLIIGLSFHKAASGFDQYAGSGAYEWANNDDVLYRSLLFVSSMERCSGVAVFSYQHFRNALTGEIPDYPKSERDNFLPLFKQTVFGV